MSKKAMRVLTIVLTSTILISFSSVTAFGVTGKSGVPYHFNITSTKWYEGEYYCPSCGRTFDYCNYGYAHDWVDLSYYDDYEQRWYNDGYYEETDVEVCPYCRYHCPSSDPWFRINENDWGWHGSYLDRIEIKSGKTTIRTIYSKASSSKDHYYYYRKIRQPITIYTPGQYTCIEYWGSHYPEYDEYKTWQKKYILIIRGKVTFHQGSGAKIKSSQKVRWLNQNAKLKSLPKATRPGYKFLGWYTQKKGGKRVYPTTHVKFTKYPKNYYAHWKKI